MTAPGVNDTSPATQFCKYMSCTPLWEQSRTAFDTHIWWYHGMPGWAGRWTVRLCWTKSTCKYCVPVEHTTMHSTTNHQKKTLPGPGIKCRTRGVMWCNVICLDGRVCLFGTIVTLSQKSWTKKNGVRKKNGASREGGVVTCMLSKSQGTPGGDRNWLVFCTGVKIDFVFVCGPKFLVLMYGSKLTWFLCAGRKWLVFSAEIDWLGFCMGDRNWLRFLMRAENYFTLVWWSKLTWFFVWVGEIYFTSVWGIELHLVSV